MKPKLYILAFLTVSLCHIANAQDTIKINRPKSPIPAEILVGNSRLYYQLFLNNRITKNNKIGLFNISSYAADYKNDIHKNEFLTSTALYLDVFKGISINAGATFNAMDGIKPYIGFQYMRSNKNTMIFYLPSYYISHENKISNLAIIEYKPIITSKWSIYSRIQGFYSYNTEKGSHHRSYIYARLGLTYSNYTFGIGANSDWYGSKKSFKENYGLFLRVNL